ncbi:MAG: ribose-5-phosphate isomerase RpiA [Acidobacteria bacterium]|nr:ribose-5-phosphate isomerase RpiA [Acidobacteriota bacterium]
MNAADLAKDRAARRAVDFISSGLTVGLGTGSTVLYFLEELARRINDGVLSSITGISTSEATTRLAGALGIPLASLADRPHPDVTVDGADEIDPSLDLIKGLGGALLREKIVAAASRQLIVIADTSKLVPRLGTRVSLPVEVVPFAERFVRESLETIGGAATLRRTPETQPFQTDEGHWVIDWSCGAIADPAALDVRLHRIPGVIEHGLFLGLATRAVVSDGGDVRIIERPSAAT